MDLDLSLIVAMTPERIIGKAGKLPWRLPSDLARFRRITTEIGVVVPGRKTYDSILKRNFEPLPERTHVVLTRGKGQPMPPYGNVWFAHSVEESCERIVGLGGRACIIGGAEIYEIFLAACLVRTVYLTLVHASVAGDALMPQFVRDNGWRLAAGEERRRWDSRDEYDTSFWTYERVR